MSSHLSKDFWDIENNNNKCPSGWKYPKEHHNTKKHVCNYCHKEGHK